VRGVTALLLLLVLAGLPVAKANEIASPRSWPDEKCARYRAAWDEAQRRMGRDGLGAEFLARHQAFLDSGCTLRADVCPRSKAELHIANTLTLRALNAGMAGTFLPFACRAN
jgi:hypothetical protein